MASKYSAGLSKVVVSLLLVGPAFLLVFISTRGCEHKFKELENYGKVIDYSFDDARGKHFTSKSFQGEVILVTTLQTTCPDTCAISSWHMDQLIYQHIRKNRKKMKQVRIVSFITDTKGNAVEDLTAIQASMEDNIVGYDPNIWILAKGDAKPLYSIKHNKHSLLQKGKKYFGGESYTELMLLLDKTNHLRMVGRGKSEGEIRRMNQHIALLQKQYAKERKLKLKKGK
ncbi:MAG: SCO family protein [Flavobacteriia bacterium]|nr:SCO family protein [Flavobacteriia bacterium]